MTTPRKPNAVRGRPRKNPDEIKHSLTIWIDPDVIAALDRLQSLAGEHALSYGTLINGACRAVYMTAEQRKTARLKTKLQSPAHRTHTREN